MARGEIEASGFRLGSAVIWPFLAQYALVLGGMRSLGKCEVRSGLEGAEGEAAISWSSARRRLKTPLFLESLVDGLQRGDVSRFVCSDFVAGQVGLGDLFFGLAGGNAAAHGVDHVGHVGVLDAEIGNAT